MVYFVNFQEGAESRNIRISQSQGIRNYGNRTKAHGQSGYHG